MALKSLAKGLLYVLFFPLCIIAICLYAVFGIFVFFFQTIKWMILFFTGRNLYSDLPEDIEAKKIIEVNKPKEEEESPLSLYPSDSAIYGSEYVSPTFDNEQKEGEDNE